MCTLLFFSAERSIASEGEWEEEEKREREVREEGRGV